MTTVHIATARLSLRTVTLDDVKGVALSWNLDGPPLSQEEASGRVQWMLANHERNAAGRLVHLCLAIVQRETGRIIGWCGLDHRDASQAHPVLFYLLRAAYWGQGLATEAARAVLDYAFSELALARVGAAAAPDNVASMRVLEKIGMQRLGRDEEGGYAFSLSNEEFLRMGRYAVKPETTEDILELMNGHIVSAVLGTAMEVGLFWLLVERPLSVSEIAQRLNIPLNRCYYWLQILCKIGLLETRSEGYVPSAVARKAILNGPSQDTWAFQAREDRDLFLYARDLALNIGKPMSAWQVCNPTPADYFKQIEADPIYMARFTRKLYQIHSALAEQLASMLDLREAKRLLELGGGSGIVSFALLRKYRGLTSVIVDIENVCQAGRVIAAENGLEKRATYLALDFLKDDLPSGFDIVMLCDVGSFSEILFRRIHDVLTQGGRLVVVDKFAPDRIGSPPSRLLSAFLTSLESPAQAIDYMTAEVVQARLLEAGFRDISTTSVPPEDNLPWNTDWTMLQARKQTNVVSTLAPSWSPIER